VDTSALATAAAVVKVGTMLLKARLSGGNKNNPFFQPDLAGPIRAPQVLSLEERRALTP
jgi:hypothetical protein